MYDLCMETNAPRVTVVRHRDGSVTVEEFTATADRFALTVIEVRP